MRSRRQPHHPPAVDDTRAVWGWFSSLSVGDRVRATTSTQDSHAVTLLLSVKDRLSPALPPPPPPPPQQSRQPPLPPPPPPRRRVLIFDWDDVTGEFCVTASPRLTPICVEESPLCRRAAAAAESALVAAVRLSWANGPGDPYATPDLISLHPRILSSARVFRRIMLLVTSGGFLANPCRVECHQEPGGKVAWKWSSPQWWNDRWYRSLAQYVASVVEQTIWMRYFEACLRDPRVPKCTKRFSFPQPSTSAVAPFAMRQPLARKNVVSMWNEMSGSERRVALSQLAPALQPRPPAFAAYRGLLDTLAAGMPEPRTVMSVSDPEALEDALFFSTLARFGQLGDRIMKHAAACLVSAYAEKLTRDLVGGDLDSAPGKSSKSKKKRPTSSKGQRRNSGSLEASRAKSDDGGAPPASLSAPSSAKSPRKFQPPVLAEAPAKDEPSPAPAATAAAAAPSTTPPLAPASSPPHHSSPPKPSSADAAAAKAAAAAHRNRVREMRYMIDYQIFPVAWKEIQRRKAAGLRKEKKKRRAGPSAAALDLAADLEHGASPQQPAVLAVPSDSLDLATPKAAARPLPPDPPTPQPARPPAAAIATTEALDLAREKKNRNPRRVQRTGARSHSNTRKEGSPQRSRSREIRTPPREHSAGSLDPASGRRHLASSSGSDFADGATTMRRSPGSAPGPTPRVVSLSSSLPVTRSKPPPLPASHPGVRALESPTHPHEIVPPFFPPSRAISVPVRPPGDPGRRLSFSQTAPPSPRVLAKPTYLDKLLLRPSYALDLATAETAEQRPASPRQAEGSTSSSSAAALDLANPAGVPAEEPLAMPVPSSPGGPGMKPTYLSRLLNRTGSEVTYYDPASPPKPIFPFRLPLAKYPQMRPVPSQPQPQPSQPSQSPPAPVQPPLAPSQHQRSHSETPVQTLPSLIALANAAATALSTPHATAAALPPAITAADQGIVSRVLRRNRSSPLLVASGAVPIAAAALPPLPTAAAAAAAAAAPAPTVVGPGFPPPGAVEQFQPSPSGSPGFFSTRSDDSELEADAPVSLSSDGVRPGFLDLVSPPTRERTYSGTPTLLTPPPAWKPWVGDSSAATLVHSPDESPRLTPSPSGSPTNPSLLEAAAAPSATAVTAAPVPRQPQTHPTAPLSPTGSTASKSPRVKREKSPAHHPQDALDLADVVPAQPGRTGGASWHLDLATSRPALMFGPAVPTVVQAPAVVLPPWANGTYSALQTPSQRLSREIRDFALYVVQLFEDSKHLYEAMVAKVVTVTQRVLPEARVQAFGSYATGLCIPTSDLDLVCSIQETSMENFRRAFRTLARELRKEDWVAQIKPIETATVPIIKLVSREEYIPTDITFDCTGAGVTQHRGLRSVELMKRYAAETPKLKSILLVLKQFLYERGLNNPYTGGLGSYCLVLMIRTFLQLYDAPAAATPLDEGSALIGFLRYYGTAFDYATTGISVRHRGVHFRIGDVGHFAGTGPLVIEDPFDPMTNIASGVFAMWRVRAAFESAFIALTGPDIPGVPTLLSRILRHDDDQN